MCGVLSTRRAMKSSSEPRISDDTARKNATPSTTPSREAMVCLRRVRRWLQAMSTYSCTGAAGASVRGPEPVAGRDVVGWGDDQPLVTRNPAADLGLQRADDADFHRQVRRATRIDRPHGAVHHRGG